MSQNSTINQRIDELVKTLFKGNNSKFAEIIGTSEANVRNYRSTTSPKWEILKAIHDKLEISYEWLLDGLGEMKISEFKLPVIKSIPISAEIAEGYNVNSNIRNIPLVDIESAAGAGALNPDYLEVLGYVSIPADSLSSRTAIYYAIRSRGESMFPTIYNSDILIIRQLEAGEWNDIRDEHVYVCVTRDGRTFTKRIKNRLNRGFAVFISDNLDKLNYPNFTLEADELYRFYYPEIRITSQFPNINGQYFDRLRALEDRFDILEKNTLKLIQ